MARARHGARRLDFSLEADTVVALGAVAVAGFGAVLRHHDRCLEGGPARAQEDEGAAVEASVSQDETVRERPDDERPHEAEHERLRVAPAPHVVGDALAERVRGVRRVLVGADDAFAMSNARCDCLVKLRQATALGSHALERLLMARFDEARLTDVTLGSAGDARE